LRNLIDGNDSNILLRILDRITNYLLPFLLYLFLFILLTDILMLLRLVYKKIRGEKLEKLKLGYGWMAVLFSLSAIVLIYGIVNFNNIRVTRYNISVPARSSDSEKFRIVFVSDLHLGDEVPLSFVKKFVEISNGLQPDVVLFGGDIVEGGSFGAKSVEFGKILRGLRPVYGVFGVKGNHDGYGRSNTDSFFRDAGIVILGDTAVSAGKSFVIAGREDSRSRERKPAAEIIGSVKEDLPVILLDHRPTDYEAIGRTRADIVMSGHTHHGQLFPINLITNSVYELSYGHLKKGGTSFFVSSGLRLWGPPVRTTARSEIVLVDVDMK
jgi:predicted MPP superfamily phosphohydrolase